MDAEREVQRPFRIARPLAGLIMAAVLVLAHRALLTIPNRHELGWRDARVAFNLVPIDAEGLGPLKLVGAWKLTSDDPRFGGISALAVDRGRMLALTDSGVLVRFSAPGQTPGPAWIGELPDGPGSPNFKPNRDSEALLRDPQDRGWWVAFENRDELWLYDRDFGRALERIHLGSRGWGANRGVEGMAPDGTSLQLLPESGDSLLRVTESRARSMPIANARGRISDAAALGPRQSFVIERRLTPLGFRNALVMLDKTPNGYRFGRRQRLPLGPIDNAEALAIQRLANGTRRLWLMTDDNLQPPLRTLLIALDLPARKRKPTR
ncbi:MAG: esterase-like activity of phytase family protein [Sphingomicrobium sp.]